MDTTKELEIVETRHEPAVSKAGKPITYYWEDAVRMRKFDESGVLQRWTGTRWVFAPGTAKNTITTDNARDIALTRWDKYQEAAMHGIMAATKTELDTDAVKAFTQEAAKHAIAGGKGGASYMQQAREMAGLVQPKQQGEQQPGSFQLTVTGSVDELRKVMARQYEATDSAAIGSGAVVDGELAGELEERGQD